MIPQLIAVQENPKIRGLLIVLNTVGGDVEAGLALAELISSISSPPCLWCWAAATYRYSAGHFGGLFLYRSQCGDDTSSGSHHRSCDRRGTDL